MAPVKTASRNHRRSLKNRTRAGARKRPAAARRACTFRAANCVENYDSIYEIASDPGYIDEPVIRVEPAASETLYYHRNHQYSVTALTSSAGAIVERYAYTAYGEPKFLSGTGTVLTDSAKDNRYTYTGREWDKAIGLYHFRARMYDAESGRFCGRDLIGYRVKNMSLFGFFRASPIMFVDPIGTIEQRADNVALDTSTDPNVRKVCCKYRRGWLLPDDFAREIDCPLDKTSGDCCEDHTNLWRWYTVLDSAEGPCECTKKLALTKVVMLTTAKNSTHCDARTRGIVVTTWIAVEICTWGDMDFPTDTEIENKDDCKKCMCHGPDDRLVIAFGIKSKRSCERYPETTEGKSLGVTNCWCGK